MGPLSEFKTCAKCNQTLIIDNFYRNKRTGLEKICKSCWNARVMARCKSGNPKTKQSIRNSMLKVNYNITPEEFDELMAYQNSRCAICEKDLTVFSKLNAPHVDHDHASNLVRGILCRSCNSGLGFFKDNPCFLKWAQDYLEDSLAYHVLGARDVTNKK